jgi:WD40 repeat protein
LENAQSLRFRSRLIAALIIIGQILACAAAAQNAPALSTVDPVPVLNLRGATSRIWQLTFDKVNGRLLAVFDGGMEVIDIHNPKSGAGKDGQSNPKIDFVRGYFDPATKAGYLVAIAISPDGKTIAVSGRCSTMNDSELIRIYDAESLALKTTVKVSGATYVTNLCWSEDGRYLICTPPKQIRIFDSRNWTLVNTYTINGEVNVPPVSMNVDGAAVIYAAYDSFDNASHSLAAFHLTGTGPYLNFRLPNECSAIAVAHHMGRLAYSLASHRDADELRASGYRENYVVYCDNALNELCRVDLRAVSAGYGMDFSPDEKYLITAATAPGATFPNNFVFPQLLSVSPSKLFLIGEIADPAANGVMMAVWTGSNTVSLVGSDAVTLTGERLDSSSPTNSGVIPCTRLWTLAPEGAGVVDTVDWLPGGIGLTMTAPPDCPAKTGMYALREAFDLSTHLFRELGGITGIHKNPVLDTADFLHVRFANTYRGFNTRLYLYRGTLLTNSGGVFVPEFLNMTTSNVGPYSYYKENDANIIFHKDSDEWRSATISDNFIFAEDLYLVYIIDRSKDPMRAGTGARASADEDTEGHDFDYELSGVPELPGIGGPSPDGQWYATGGRNGEITVWFLGNSSVRELVTSVTAGGDSANAGLQRNDLIVGFDGQRFRNMALFRSYELSRTDLNFNIERNGRPLTIHCSRLAKSLGYISTSAPVVIPPSYHLIIGERKRDGSRSWLVWTPHGFFDGSSDGVESFGWVVNHRLDQASDFYPAKQLSDSFYQPELIRKLIVSGKEDTAIASEMHLAGGLVSALQGVPKAKWQRRQSNSTDNESIELGFSVEDTGGGVGEIDIRVNGKRIDANEWNAGSEPTSNSGKFLAHLRLTHGLNKITLSASNRLHTTSAPDDLLITRRGQAKPGTLYILTIAITKFSNAEYETLSAADIPSALRLGDEFSNIGVLYKNVVRMSLFDSEATGAGIRRKLADIARLSNPEDTVIIILSTHGGAWNVGENLVKGGKAFYIVTYDLNGKDPESVITSRSLKSLLSNIVARKQLLILSTCHAGLGLNQILDFNASVQKQMNNLSQGGGLAVIAACSADQGSWEDEKNGSWFFHSLKSELDALAKENGPIISCQALIDRVRGMGSIAFKGSLGDDNIGRYHNNEDVTKESFAPIGLMQGNDFPLEVASRSP